ncbi:hypothetical protein Tco_1371924 [Tanacetum coccineum]
MLGNALTCINDPLIDRISNTNGTREKFNITLEGYLLMKKAGITLWHSEVWLDKAKELAQSRHHQQTLAKHVTQAKPLEYEAKHVTQVQSCEDKPEFEAPLEAESSQAEAPLEAESLVAFYVSTNLSIS